MYVRSTKPQQYKAHTSASTSTIQQKQVPHHQQRQRDTTINRHANYGLYQAYRTRRQRQVRDPTWHQEQDQYRLSTTVLTIRSRPAWQVLIVSKASKDIPSTFQARRLRSRSYVRRTSTTRSKTNSNNQDRHQHISVT